MSGMERATAVADAGQSGRAESSRDAESRPGAGAETPRRLRVMFFVEGFTDIRFVTGLSEAVDLTMVVPARQYAESQLKQRVAQSRARLTVIEIPGGRVAFQLRSLALLWRRIREFDVVLSQEVLRGSLNATVVGRLRGVPVVTYMGIAPIEYFRCRRERGLIGWWKSLIGVAAIRAMLGVNGRLAARTLAMGPYLRDVAARYSKRAEVGLYYGVDTEFFRPASESERAELRRRRDLPLDKFVIFLSSRISHEKDPETVLRATSIARSRGLDAVLINLGGGYAEFLELARRLELPDAGTWVLGRPPAHPMVDLADYFRAADVMALASLAEGAAYSTLEALSCGTPVVATAVGGMAVQLAGYARLTPRRDAGAMAEQFLWIASHPEEARAQAMSGRAYIEREWNRQKAFEDLEVVLRRVAEENR
ncbi:MAG TPA: glycosyltransferase [Gemmatimonadaceae bacterium]|nr:glycosyltransferase [Gemmatimonadaceae bacterium]